METGISWSVILLFLTVLTVPMRNGNAEATGEDGAIKRVLTVPMRNGNRSRFKKIVKRYKVLTVPMRNGNLQEDQVKAILL